MVLPRSLISNPPALSLSKGQSPVSNPLVGRASEIARLSAALDAVVAGESRILALDGEVGIGKSRLVGELARLTRERGLTGLLGAGQSIEQQTPYRAWRDILNSYFDLDEVEDRAERRQRVQVSFNDLLPDLGERLPLLNDVLNLDLPDTELTRALDPVLRSESLTNLLVELLRAWATEQPLILVLEDAHWLDSRLWELAVRVARSLAAANLPLLLVLSLRPLESTHPAMRHLTALLGLPGASRLSLGRLAADATTALVAALLGLDPADVPEPVAALVRQRAEGNPFFAEEIIVALRDQRLITTTIVGEDEPGERPRCVIIGDLKRAGEVLPDTLQGLLLARIDRLPPEEQLTLKMAAVIGPTFEYHPLHYTRARHAATDEAALKNQLRALAANAFTELEAPEPDLAYSFRHILTQEAAYQTLLFEQRRALHRTVAEWYEALSDDAGSGVPERSLVARHSSLITLLAHHYRYAEDVERERHYAHLAGIGAADRYANTEALAFFARALELTPEDKLDRRYELLLVRERVYDIQGMRAEQQQAIGTLEQLAARLGDGRRQVEVALRRASYAEATGDYPASCAAAQRATILAHTLGLTAQEALSYHEWGRVLIRQSDYGAAHIRLTEALTVARAAQLPGIEANTLRSLGLVALDQGDYAQAKEYLTQSLYICRQHGDKQGEGIALGNLGNVASMQGNVAEAHEAFATTLDHFRAIGYRCGETIALAKLGHMAIDVGDYSTAHTYLVQGLQRFRELGDRYGERNALLQLGRIAFRQGDYVAAQTYHE